MYAPFNHNLIINLAIMNNLQKLLTFMGKKVYKMCLFNLWWSRIDKN